jgi:hypothetical protein
VVAPIGRKVMVYYILYVFVGYISQPMWSTLFERCGPHWLICIYIIEQREFFFSFCTEGWGKAKQQAYLHDNQLTIILIGCTTPLWFPPFHMDHDILELI